MGTVSASLPEEGQDVQIPNLLWFTLILLLGVLEAGSEPGLSWDAGAVNVIRGGVWMLQQMERWDQSESSSAVSACVPLQWIWERRGQVAALLLKGCDAEVCVSCTSYPSAGVAGAFPLP